MSSIAADLAKLLAGVQRPGDFCTTGVATIFAPGLEIEGVGPISLPFPRIQLEALIAAAEQAPYGRGNQTLVDTDIRRSWQIDAGKVHIHGKAWARSLQEIVDRVAAGLGVSDPIKPELYKLLAYDEGGFFVSHRDTEKAPGMFATLIIVLPSAYTGGELVVRHRDREIRFDPHGQDPSEVAFAAFYADCLHELLPVTSGCRLALVYNLLRQGTGDAPRPPSHEAERDSLADLLRRWSEDESPVRRRDDEPSDEDAYGDEDDEGEDDEGEGDEEDGPPAKLIYPLEHVYTTASLSFDALKGADAARAATLLAAARAAHCDLHLAVLSIEESGSAEYTGYGIRSRGRHYDDETEEDEFDVIEVMESHETLSEWRRPDGSAPALGVLPVNPEEVSPPDALDDLVPDKQSFFEATGNEGASFERSYRKAALVVWPNSRRLAIVNQGSLGDTLHYLADLTEQWAAGGGDPQSPSWALAHELSGHMLATWPKRSWSTAKGPSDATTMLNLLGRLDDVAHIDRFLAEVSVGALSRGDNEAVLQAVRRLPRSRRIELLTRIVTESAPSALDIAANLLVQAARAAEDGSLDLPPADLLPAAAGLLAALPGDPAEEPPIPSWQWPAPIEPDVVVDAVTALAQIDSKLAGAAVDTLLAWPKTYDLDEVLVPVVLKLDRSASSAAMMRLRTACALHLGARIAEPLAPPADWRRPSAVKCSCERCSLFRRFLADPRLQTWSYKAVQADRSHVESTIREGRYDVDVTTLRQGSPHTLVCTKNQASYERRVLQRKKDLVDLAQIESLYPS
ncbi:2OG-Fe(II) oxygenase [Labrys monachus]|uniref:2-oxoglutarate/Fe(II)-dependent dioxygenase YbiX n=1 Tax=Labrys monachus TaxID=217067 RepID=A0ABU0FEW9_9HYPH|nr:2OG-Fe(II) oxygenase [Labrys monachus]MDQ0393162.1 putative 2-oxoglutarate/Fe(II)-dependent dioxygenase YbiX [Labrys monachus]